MKYVWPKCPKCGAQGVAVLAKSGWPKLRGEWGAACCNKECHFNVEADTPYDALELFAAGGALIVRMEISKRNFMIGADDGLRKDGRHSA